MLEFITFRELEQQTVGEQVLVDLKEDILLREKAQDTAYFIKDLLILSLIHLRLLALFHDRIRIVGQQLRNSPRLIIDLIETLLEGIV